MIDPAALWALQPVNIGTVWHVAGGVLAAWCYLKTSQAASIFLGWELIEPGLVDLLPGAGDASSLNAFVDVVASLGGFLVATRWLPVERIRDEVQRVEAWWREVSLR